MKKYFFWGLEPNDDPVNNVNPFAKEVTEETYNEYISTDPVTKETSRMPGYTYSFNTHSSGRDGDYTNSSVIETKSELVNFLEDNQECILLEGTFQDLFDTLDSDDRTEINQEDTLERNKNLGEEAKLKGFDSTEDYLAYLSQNN